METGEVVRYFSEGSVTFIDREGRTPDVPWSVHPKFEGVWLKHLVKGVDTDGLLSCSMVRLDPGASLEYHVHDGQWELHEVIDGEGVFFMDSRETRYYPGRMAVIPRGTRHRVVAGDKGLVLCAKFFPASV